MISFICSLWGDKYSTKYVQKLYESVKDNYIGEFAFYCQTDKVLGIDGAIELPFSKFQPIMDGRFPDKPKCNIWEPNCWGIMGKKVYLDLDILIQGNLNKITELHANKILINRSHWQDDAGINSAHNAYLCYRGVTNSSIIVWEDTSDTKEIWEHIVKNSEYIFFVCINGSDNYLSSEHMSKFDFVPRPLVASYHNETPSVEPIIYTFETQPGQLEMHELGML